MPRSDLNLRRPGARYIAVAGCIAFVCCCLVGGCGGASEDGQPTRSSVSTQPTAPPVPTESVAVLAGRLGDEYDERASAISRALDLFAPPMPRYLKAGFVPEASLLEELAPFFDAFQSLVRHPDYSLDQLMAQGGAGPSAEPRPGRMRIVETAAKLMYLRVLDQALRGEHEESLRSAADCFRAGKTSPSSPALCLWYCSSVSGWGRNSAWPAVGRLRRDPRTPEEYLHYEEFLERMTPSIEETLESARDLRRTIDEILEKFPEGKDDASMSGIPEGNPDHAWFVSYCRGVTLTTSERAVSLKVGRMKLDDLIEDFPTLNGLLNAPSYR